MNCPDRSSSASPVRPKRVLTSPIAAPAVPKSVGMDVARFSILFCMSSRASPDAPVFLMMVSVPSSTALKDASAATPSAMIGAVVYFVILAPASVIFFPVSLIFFPAFFADFPRSSRFSLMLLVPDSLFRSSSCLFMEISSVWASASCCFHLLHWVLFSPYFSEDVSTAWLSVLIFFCCSSIF